MKSHHIANYFLLQQYYFTGLAQVLGILLLTLYFIFGVQATSMPIVPLLIFYVPVLLWQQVIFIWLQQFNIDPQHEKGIMWRAKLLNYAAWPIYFLALIGVVMQKRLTYKVTPKGSQQETTTSLSLFVPHFILGTITAIDIIVGTLLHHDAIQLIFWAAANTFFMYFFVLYILIDKLDVWLKKIRRGKYSLKLNVANISLPSVNLQRQRTRKI